MAHETQPAVVAEAEARLARLAALGTRRDRVVLNAAVAVGAR
jgi:hypothetical protein